MIEKYLDYFDRSKENTLVEVFCLGFRLGVAGYEEEGLKDDWKWRTFATINRCLFYGYFLGEFSLGEFDYCVVLLNWLVKVFYLTGVACVATAMAVAPKVGMKEMLHKKWCKFKSDIDTWF